MHAAAANSAHSFADARSTDENTAHAGDRLLQCWHRELIIYSYSAVSPVVFDNLVMCLQHSPARLSSSTTSVQDSDRADRRQSTAPMGRIGQRSSLPGQRSVVVARVLALAALMLCIVRHAQMDSALAATWRWCRASAWFRHDSWEPFVVILAWPVFSAFWCGPAAQMQVLARVQIAPVTDSVSHATLHAKALSLPHI